MSTQTEASGNVRKKSRASSQKQASPRVKGGVAASRKTLADAVHPSKPVPDQSLEVSVAGEIKTSKTRKQKLIRDSFKFPESEYRQFDELKLRCLAAGHPVKKSELVRAGLRALGALGDEALLNCVAEVEKLKTGRPAS